MGDDEKKLEETEIGSQGPIDEIEEQTPTRTLQEVARGEQKEIIEEEPTPIPQTGVSVGNIRDRLTAGIIDCMALGYLYAGLLFIYNFAVWHEMLRPIPSHGIHALIFHAIFLLAAFLYFFIFEGVFFTTLGKLLARLSVRDTLGRPASLLAIFLRNLLRPIDYLLSFFPTWILLEKLALRQRLGDIVAGTVVMKHYAKAPQRLPVTGYTASATLRILAGIVDFALSALWIGGILLLIDHERPFLSLLILMGLPIFYLLWHVSTEVLFQTTFGLWLAGLKIVGEDGAPIGFVQAFLRALFRLFDSNPIGWMTLYLSHKNQRPSDLAAATVVVHAKRNWNALIGMGVSLALIGTVWMVGFSNPRSYLTSFFKTDFLKTIFTIRTGGLPAATADKKGLFVKSLTYLNEDRTTPRANETFKSGERIFFAFDVTGFTVRDNEAWMQEDLTVRYPDQAIGFKQEKIVDFHQNLKDPDQPVEIVNTLILPAAANPGYYTLVITLHDRLSDRHLTEQRTFRVEQ